MKLLRYLPIAMLLALFVGIQVPATTAQTGSSGATWNAVYYNNAYLGEPSVLNRQETNLNFDWGTASPDEVVNEDYFSARFTTSFTFLEDFYRFRATADDGLRVIIDNNITLIDTFDNPRPGEIITADVDMSAGVHTIQVDYREITGLALLQLGWQPIDNPGETQYIPPTDDGVTVINPDPISPTSNWTGRYYSNTNLSGQPTVVVNELSPSHNWGIGAPVFGVPADNFSAEWTSNAYLDGTYEISVRADDGVRVYVDGQLYIDEWHPAANATYTRRFTVAEGNHSITVQMYEAGGVAFLEYDLTPVNNVIVNPDPIINPASDWLVQYYDNAGLSGEPILTQSENSVSRTWGQGAPLASMSPDRFSVRFISTQEFDAGTYLIRVSVDDGVRVYVDDQLYIDEWHLNDGSVPYTAEVSLSAGSHTITIEYYENTQNAFIEYSIDPVNTGIVDPPVTGSGATATVTASLLNVRSGPNVFEPVLTQIERGETYPVLGQNTAGTWIQLNVNGQIGWVNESYTDEFNYTGVPVTDNTVVDVAPVTGETLTTTANLNMRRGPGLEFDVIRVIPENTVVSIEARTIDSDWWQVSFDGNIGWVTEAFVNIPPTVDTNNIAIAQ